MMFADSWKFEYSKKEDDDKKISERLKYGSKSKYNLLKEYHGINVIERMGGDGEEVYNIVKCKVEKNIPVALILDVYWCPWHFGMYNKVHSLHYLLVVGVDEEKEELICIDSQMAKKGERLDKINFMKALKGYTLFEFLEPKRKVCMKTILNEAIDNLYNEEKNKNIFKEMRELSEDFLFELDINNEIQGYEEAPNASPFFSRLSEIAHGRSHFAKTIRYMGKEFNKPELITISNCLDNVSDKWSSIVGMLLKAYFLKDQEKLIQRAANKILELSRLEEEIMVNIKKIIEDDYVVELKNLNSYNNYNGTIGSYEFIELKDYFNNKGVSLGHEAVLNAEISNPGRFIMVDEIPSDGILKVENMKFDIRNIKNYDRDNIMCDGQEICIHEEHYDYIMFLGCSEFGNFNETAQILYEDDKIESFNINFTSWLLDKSSYDEVIAITGKGAVKLEKEINFYPFAVNLFAKCYKLEGGGKIIKIILPECSNMHVFSITLGKAI